MKFLRALAPLLAASASIFAAAGPLQPFDISARSSEPHHTYDGWKVYRLQPDESWQETNKLLKAEIKGWTHWSQGAMVNFDIAVPPSQTKKFESLGIEYKVMHKDLGESVRASLPSKHGKWKAKRDMDEWFEDYHEYDEHVEYFEELHGMFPDNSEIVSSGKSHGGREIFGIHLWGNDGPGKPAVLYHSTVHAREWITTPVVEYIAKSLIEGYKTGRNDTAPLLDKMDYFIFPIVNPDGFVHSHEEDRMWRKNRQPAPKGFHNQSCVGTDINRNFESFWDANPVGASPDPCQETYRGPAPNSAPETVGLDEFARRLRDGPGIKFYVDWHSYSQLIMYPYAHRPDLQPSELGKFQITAAYGAGRILHAGKNRRGGSGEVRTFQFGPVAPTLYATTGDAMSHMYSTCNVEFPFLVELPDTGDHGFLFPKELIREVAEEQWLSQRMMQHLIHEEYFDGEGFV